MDGKKYSKVVDYIMHGCMCGHFESCEACDPSSSFNMAKEALLEIPEFRLIYEKKMLRWRLNRPIGMNKWQTRRMIHCYSKGVTCLAQQKTSKIRGTIKEE